MILYKACSLLFIHHYLFFRKCEWCDFAQWIFSKEIKQLIFPLLAVFVKRHSNLLLTIKKGIKLKEKGRKKKTLPDVLSEMKTAPKRPTHNVIKW